MKEDDLKSVEIDEGLKKPVNYYVHQISSGIVGLTDILPKLKNGVIEDIKFEYIDGGTGGISLTYRETPKDSRTYIRRIRIKLGYQRQKKGRKDADR